MNNLKHNKKRNIGLLNEFFAKYITSCILDQKNTEVEKTKAIWKKYMMAPDSSELVKEHQIFDTLYHTRVTDKEAAYSLLRVIKEAVLKQDIKTLNDEKTRLLHEINNHINDASFFEQPVQDYRTQAMVQTLINSWRESSENILAVQNSILLEEQIVKHLLSKPIVEEKDYSVLDYGDEEINGLVFSIMLEKFNKVYGTVLSNEQKELLNLYMFSTSDAKMKDSLVLKMESIKNDTVELLNKECFINHGNKNLVDKYNKIKSVLNESTYSNIKNDIANNDDMITFFLSVSKLKEELLSEEETLNNNRKNGY